MPRTIDEALCGEKRQRLLQDIVESTGGADHEYRHAASEIARRTGMSVRSVRRCLKDFLEAGLIEQVGEGRRPGSGGSPVKYYAATEVGTHALAKATTNLGRDKGDKQGDTKGDKQGDKQGDMRDMRGTLSPPPICGNALPHNKVPDGLYLLIEESIENGRLTPEHRDALVTIAQNCPIALDEQHASSLIEQFQSSLEAGFTAIDMVEAVNCCAQWHQRKIATDPNYDWKPWAYKIIDPERNFMVVAKNNRERREAAAASRCPQKGSETPKRVVGNGVRDEAVEIAEALDRMAPKHAGKRMDDVVATVRRIASRIPDAQKRHFVEAYKKYLEYAGAKDYALMWLTNRTSTNTYEDPMWAVAHMLVVDEQQM